MPENRLVRAQRITMEVMRDPEWRDRDVSDQFEECKRRIDEPDERPAAGIVYIPEPKREPIRPTVPASQYPPGTRWMSEDNSVWEIDWDNQDKRYTWFQVSQPTAPVHWVGDAPTSLHGNGAASFERTTRDRAEVTCSLCLTLLDRESSERESDG